MMSHVEFVSFHTLGAEISWIKRFPELQTGGTPSKHSGGHLSPEGECVAPLGAETSWIKGGPGIQAREPHNNKKRLHQAPHARMNHIC